MKEENGDVSQEVAKILGSTASSRESLMRLAERRRTFAIGVLIFAVLSAVFGLYIDKPEAAFNRYAFLVNSVLLAIGGGFYFDSANKLTQRAAKETEEALAILMAQSVEPPDSNGGGEGIRRIK